MTEIQPAFETFHQTSLGQIIHGDSLDVLALYADESVHLIMTSPPFGLVRKKDYGNVEADEYVNWFKPFAAEFHRVLKDSGSLVIDIGGAWNRGYPTRNLYHFKLLIMLCEEAGFHLAQDFYWWNPSKLPTPAEWVTVRRVRVKDAINTVWWLSKTPWPKASNRRVLQPYSPSMQDLLAKGYRAKKRPSGHDISNKFSIDNGAAIPPNLIAIPNTESNSFYLRYCEENGFKPHPARYPAELPEYFIRMLTERGDIVIDPFAGSCVTGEVCERTERRWTCIELLYDYCEAALGRFVRDPQETVKPVTNPDAPSNYYRVPRPGILWDGDTGSRLPSDGGKERRLKPKKAAAGKLQKAQVGSDAHEAISSASVPPTGEQQGNFMETNAFQTREPSIGDNPRLRTPQREAYVELARFAGTSDKQEREVGIVLPVGCGKSGCITIAPFAFHATRTLVVAPGIKIAQQLHDDFDPARPDMFYIKCGVLNGQPYPEPAEIRGTATNRDDLEEADVVVTNIHQLQGGKNRWLQKLPDDFFDLILFDEGHHNIAQSWNTLKAKFARAWIVNFSATPLRADGQLMAGRILYSYPVFRAIQEGYVKRLKAIVLNPQTLRYVRREDGQEIEVTLDEVRRLGEQDADFRRSIVTSTETLNTIVDASIRELDKLRQAADDDRLKIIASALNYEHCRQIVQAYRSRGRHADYVHSREVSPINKRVLQRLENHDLDVIVQVRKLAEGFDHPFLAVAAVFSIFANLSPFVQFVGRIMRVIEQNAPGHILNRGSVVFHAGANVASRWADFQTYSEADREFFDQLLPLEDLDFSSGERLEVEPTTRDVDDGERFDVRSQTAIRLEEIPLIAKDPEALAALRALRERGYSSDEVKQAYDELEPVPVTRTRQRQAMRSSLDMRVRTETGRILGERDVNPEAHELDRKRLGRTNFIVLKAAIDRQVNAAVGRQSRKRHEFTRPELEQIERDFTGIVGRAVQDVFGATN